MKRVYVDEKWCLGCHLCEYNCAFANSGKKDMVSALKGVKPNPRIRVEEGGDICFAVSCRHCSEPLCVKSCISGAMSVHEGVIKVDRERCVGCLSCVTVSYTHLDVYKRQQSRPFPKASRKKEGENMLKCRMPR